MSTVDPRTRALAGRLIALGAECAGASGKGECVTARVVDKLRVRLARLAGVAGYKSLLSRALALARAELPSLNKVQVRPDGTLESFDPGRRTDDVAAGAVLIAHLLGLLVTFIGEPLTLGFVRDAWPDADITGLGAGKEGQV